MSTPFRTDGTRRSLMVLLLVLAAPLLSDRIGCRIEAQAASQSGASDAPSQLAGPLASGDEFALAVRTASSLAAAHHGDTARFLTLVQPFGPADLSIATGKDPVGVARLRQFFYGAVMSAAGIDRGWGLARHSCDRACSASRRAQLAPRAEAVAELAAHFRRLGAPSVVAVWPGGETRVDDVILSPDSARRLLRTAERGILPAGAASLSDGGAAALETLGIHRASLDSLARGMRAAGIAALAREGGDIRAVAAGSVSTREWGLVFGDAPALKAGEVTADGRRVVTVESLLPGVHYYLTR